MHGFAADSTFFLMSRDKKTHRVELNRLTMPTFLSQKASRPGKNQKKNVPFAKKIEAKAKYF